MAAEVRINFVIGGADQMGRMRRTILQSAEMSARQEQAMRVARAREGYRLETQLAVEAERQKNRVANDGARQRGRIAAEEARQQNRLAVENTRSRLAMERDAARQAAREDERSKRERKRDNDREVQARQKALLGTMGAAGRGALAGVGAIASGVKAAGGMAGRVGGEIASGLGLDFSLGSAIRRKGEQQRLATDIANSASKPTDTTADRIKTATELQASAQKVATETAMDPTKILEGIQKFVSKTGDLQSANETIRELAILSRATGTAMDDMVSAAGDVSANLGDIPNKGEAVIGVMRAMAGQGKLGAVEIRDLATQMAGMAAQVSAFGGDKQKTFAALGAMAQESRQKGGSKSAAQAVTSVQSFVNTFSKGARRKEFKAAGVQIEDDKGQLLDPEQIIVNSLKATGGNKEKMGKLFMDVQARRAVKGFENIYTEAGGGEQGIAAVRAEFAKLRESSMGGGEVQAAFDASMQTGEAKAQLLQQKIESIVASLADTLVPAFLRMVPVAEQAAAVLQRFVDAIAPHSESLAKSFSELIGPVENVVQALAKFVGWAVEYPKATAASVIGAFMAKELLSRAISNMMVTAANVVVSGGGGLGSKVGELATGGGALSGAKSAASRLVAGATAPMTLASLGTAGGAAAAGGSALLGAAIGTGLGYVTGTAAHESDMRTDESVRTKAAFGTNLASKIRMGNATAEDRKMAETFASDLEGKTGIKGALSRAFEQATAGARGLAQGDITAENLITSIPTLAAARGAMSAAFGGQSSPEAGASAKELRDALAMPQKPVELAPGQQLNVTVTNWGEMPRPADGSLQGPKAPGI